MRAVVIGVNFRTGKTIAPYLATVDDPEYPYFRGIWAEEKTVWVQVAG